MDQSNRGARSATLTKAQIADVDSRFASPSERALYIWQYIKDNQPDLTDWDLICFSSEFLGMMARVYPWLEEDVKRLSNLVYTAHYLNGEVIDAASFIKRDVVQSRESRSQPETPAPRSEPAGERQGNSDRVVQTRFFT